MARLNQANPFNVVLSKMKPLGGALELGTVSAVGTGVVTVDVRGVSLPDVPYVGTAPSVNDDVWLLRTGTTVVVI